MREYNKQFGKCFSSLEPALKKFFLEYSWNGNVRELKNSIERAVLLGYGKKLKLSQFSFLTEKHKFSGENDKTESNLLIGVDYKMTDIRKLNIMYAANVLKKEAGNKTKTAKVLGISRPKLDSLLGEVEKL